MGDLKSPFEREPKLGGGDAQSGWSSRCADATARVAWRHAMSSVDEEDKMFWRNLIKHSLVIGLAIGAASLPAVAQARPIQDTVAPVASPVVSTPSAQQQLARLHADVQHRFASEGGRPSVAPSVATSVRSGATPQGGFRWGDAGIGAAGMIVLLGAGAGTVGVMRNRRAHRPVAG